MTTPYMQLPAHLSNDPATACTELLEAAHAGQIVGLAVVMLYRRNRFSVDVVGDAVRVPVVMRGALRELDDCLREISHRRRDTPTII